MHTGCGVQSGLSGANAGLIASGIQHDGRILIAELSPQSMACPSRALRGFGEINLLPSKTSLHQSRVHDTRTASGGWHKPRAIQTNLTDTAWVDLAGDVTASASDCSTNKVDVTVGRLGSVSIVLKQVP